MTKSSVITCDKNTISLINVFVLCPLRPEQCQAQTCILTALTSKQLAAYRPRHPAHGFYRAFLFAQYHATPRIIAASGYGYGRVPGLCRYAHTRPCRPQGDPRGTPSWFTLCRKALYQKHTRIIDWTNDRYPGRVSSKGRVVSFPGATVLRRSPTDGRNDPICQTRPQQSGWAVLQRSWMLVYCDTHQTGRVNVSRSSLTRSRGASRL